MNKMLKKIGIMLFALTCIFLTYSSKSFADSFYTVKIPIDATLSVTGGCVMENSLLSPDFASGRIHDLAFNATGAMYGYKYYTVKNLSGMNDLIVYDRNMVPIMPANISVENRLIEYSSSSTDFILSHADTIRGAAIAYHNRTGGYGNGTFYNYFLKGSDAAVKCELSDSGRYWGQFVSARIIENIEIQDVVPYGDNAFTAKVRIVADGGGRGYVEDYTISFLFQKYGNSFFVTNFTFMK